MNRRVDVRVRRTRGAPDGNPLSYYWAYYAFDCATGEGRNIRAGSTCRYHLHVLDVFAGIVRSLEGHRSTYLAAHDGWRLFEAVDALLQGRGEDTGMEGSTTALYQFYRAEGKAFGLRLHACEDHGDLSSTTRQVFASRFD